MKHLFDILLKPNSVCLCVHYINVHIPIHICICISSIYINIHMYIIYISIPIYIYLNTCVYHIDIHMYINQKIPKRMSKEVILNIFYYILLLSG